MDWSKILDTLSSIALYLIAAILPALIGYYFGLARSFREQKQKAYGEILPPVVKMAYDPKSADDKEFNQALMKLWLYGSRKVVKKVDAAIASLLDPSRGNATTALQQSIALMRRDIQLLPWQRLKAEEVEHLYLRVAGKD